MHVVAFDPYVAAERYRELGVEKAETPTTVYAERRLPHAPPAQDAGDRGLARRRGVRQVKDGVRDPQRRARPADRRRGPPGRARLRQGRRRGARRVPQRADHRAPAVRLPERRRHAAPRRLDRRGDRPRRLPGRRAGRRRAHRRRVTTAVNVPADRAEDLEVLGPFVPLCRRLGRLAVALAEGSSIDRIEVEYLGRIADRDTPPADHRDAARRPARATPRRRSTPSTRRRSPRSAASTSSETKTRQRARLRPTSCASPSSPATTHRRVVGTTLGRRNRPHLLEAWGQRFNLQLEEHLALFRYERPCRA